MSLGLTLAGGAFLAFGACSGDPTSAPNGAVSGGGPGMGGSPLGGGQQGGGSQAGPCDQVVDTGRYEFDLNLPRSQSPPGGLAAADVPQFVALGWDDNGFLTPFNWALNMMRVRKVRSSFFMTTTYVSDGSTQADPGFLLGSWRAAYQAGHEIGNHTQYHPNGVGFSVDDWKDEIGTAFSFLTAAYDPPEVGVASGLGVPRQEIYGFRSPFLNYNDELFEVLRAEGIWYDCSIEEGWQLDSDASSFAWPYTLDEGSAAHEYAKERSFADKIFELSAHPGIIELPAYALVVPPDSVADEYNILPGLLDRIRALIPEREPGSDRITGLDYNLWWEAELSKEEALAILKYNLDQRLSGNRAPFLFGVHTDFYREDWEAGQVPPKSIEDFRGRQEAIEEFLDYAKGLSGVRIVTFKEVVDFLREPRPLQCFD